MISVGKITLVGLLALVLTRPGTVRAQPPAPVGPVEAPPAAAPAPAEPAPTPVGSGAVVPKVDDEVIIDPPGRLAAGSQAGAGLDPAAPGEIVHPSNPAALVASLRKLGGVLDGEQDSAVVQFNPYLMLAAEDALYEEVIAGRASVLRRWLQDSSVTVAAGRVAVGPAPAAGQTIDDVILTRPHAGVGASVELLGERSVYGAVYAECVRERTSAAGFIEAMRRKAPQPRAFIRRPGETDEAFRVRLEQDPKVAAYVSSVNAIVASIAEEVRACYQRTAAATDALFLNGGARWLLARDGLPTDEAARDRAFASLAYERFTGVGAELTFQLRALEERRPTGERLRLMDGGLSLRWATPLAALGAEATTSVVGDDRFATLSGSLQVAVGRAWAVELGVRGEGEDLAGALERATIAVSLSYLDTPARTKDLGGILANVLPAALLDR